MPYIFGLVQTYSRKEKRWELKEKRTGTLKGLEVLGQLEKMSAYIVLS